ncbi:mucin-4-like [Schistocerca piceifrons]|uniref:mucin-4-like n=1 Tax=Schistocerca piceifrons TaxID=274613 RepID=UPI001F5FCD98|nr:mucin-4-like [Schistocerca piceifrons]
MTTLPGTYAAVARERPTASSAPESCANTNSPDTEIPMDVSAVIADDLQESRQSTETVEVPPKQAPATIKAADRQEVEDRHTLQGSETNLDTEESPSRGNSPKKKKKQNKKKKKRRLACIGAEETAPTLRQKAKEIGSSLSQQMAGNTKVPPVSEERSPSALEKRDVQGKLTKKVYTHPQEASHSPEDSLVQPTTTTSTSWADESDHNNADEEMTEVSETKTDCTPAPKESDLFNENVSVNEISKDQERTTETFATGEYY